VASPQRGKRNLETEAELSKRQTNWGCGKGKTGGGNHDYRKIKTENGEKKKKGGQEKGKGVIGLVFFQRSAPGNRGGGNDDSVQA